MRHALIAGLIVSGCATVQASQKDDGPSPVVAKYGNRVIRLAEVDAKVADELSKLQERSSNSCS